MSLLITNAHLITPGLDLQGAAILVRENKNSRVIPAGEALPQADETYDAQGKMVVPGFIDMHFHGAMGYETTTDDPKAMPAIGEAKLREGVTNCCPTTLTLSEEKLTASLRHIEEYRQNPTGAQVIGTHLEGPYVNPECLGAQNPAYQRNPDLAEINRLHAVSPVSLITYAIELPGAVDFTDGLSTTIRAQIGCWHSGWEVGSQVRFGTIEYGGLVPPFARRHHFTDELVGRCYAWSYGKMLNSIHVYSSPESYSWTIFRSDGSGGPTWSSPCYYIKLREDAYILQWVEENCNGKQGLVVINPNLLHDGGFFYGVGVDGLLLNTTGAFGRELGRLDILKYFK